MIIFQTSIFNICFLLPNIGYVIPSQTEGLHGVIVEEEVCHRDATNIYAKCDCHAGVFHVDLQP